MTINKRTGKHETDSLTDWEQANATGPLARGPTVMKQVHLLSESRKMPQDHQQEDLQLCNMFTYSLWAAKCHKTISRTTSNHGTGSLTYWDQENARRPSARKPVAMEQVHLHTECTQIPQDHQPEDLQQWNRFTYWLKAGKCHQTINKRTCDNDTGPLTPWKQENVIRL